MSGNNSKSVEPPLSPQETELISLEFDEIAEHLFTPESARKLTALNLTGSDSTVSVKLLQVYFIKMGRCFDDHAGEKQEPHRFFPEATLKANHEKLLDEVMEDFYHLANHYNGNDNVEPVHAGMEVVYFIMKLYDAIKRKNTLQLKAYINWRLNGIFDTFVKRVKNKYSKLIKCKVIMKHVADLDKCQFYPHAALEAFIKEETSTVVKICRRFRASLNRFSNTDRHAVQFEIIECNFERFEKKLKSLNQKRHNFVKEYLEKFIMAKISARKKSLKRQIRESPFGDLKNLFRQTFDTCEKEIAKVAKATALGNPAMFQQCCEKILAKLVANAESVCIEFAGKERKNRMTMQFQIFEKSILCAATSSTSCNIPEKFTNPLKGDLLERINYRKHEAEEMIAAEINAAAATLKGPIAPAATSEGPTESAATSEVPTESAAKPKRPIAMPKRPIAAVATPKRPIAAVATPKKPTTDPAQIAPNNIAVLVNKEIAYISETLVVTVV